MVSELFDRGGGVEGVSVLSEVDGGLCGGLVGGGGRGRGAGVQFHAGGGLGGGVGVNC